MSKVFVVIAGGCPGVGCCEEIVGVFDSRETMLAAYPDNYDEPYGGADANTGGRLPVAGLKGYSARYEIREMNQHDDSVFGR